MKLRFVGEYSPNPDLYPAGATAHEMAAIDSEQMRRFSRLVGADVHWSVEVLGAEPRADELSVVAAESTSPAVFVRGSSNG